jgi:restriction endonuclease
VIEPGRGKQKGRMKNRFSKEGRKDTNCVVVTKRMNELMLMLSKTSKLQRNTIYVKIFKNI